MSVVFVRDPHQNSREELTIGDPKETLVRSLKAMIANKTGLQEDSLSKMYFVHVGIDHTTLHVAVCIIIYDL